MTDKAIHLINDLVSKGFTPKQIKEAMEDGLYLANAGISGELADEIHTFICKNWEPIDFYCRSSK